MILRGLSTKLSVEWKTKHVSGHQHYLHHHETCQCEFGIIGKAKKATANKKRRDFYKTERGFAIEPKYKDRAKEKKNIVALIKDLDCTSNLAEMQKETILNLLGQMK